MRPGVLSAGWLARDLERGFTVTVTLEGRDTTIVAMAVARAWHDEDYKARLLADPKETLAEEGVEFPSDVEVRMLADTATIKHINLTREVTQGADVAGLLTRLIPVPDDTEIRIVQSSETVRYLVLPAKPRDSEYLDAKRLVFNGVVGPEIAAAVDAAVELSAVATTAVEAAEVVAVAVAAAVLT